MKTKEELTALKEEVETLNKKLAELTEDELAQVVGGTNYDDICKTKPGFGQYEYHFYDIPSADFKPDFEPNF